MIIGFAGKAGSGKTTAAKTLMWGQGFTIGNFAYRMKKAVSVLFDIPIETLLGDKAVKEQLDARYDLTYRQILQRFGTEAIRGTFGQDFWVRLFWSEFWEVPKLAIDDVRFEQEAQSIISRGGLVIEIVNPLLESSEDSHSSEKGLSGELIHATVVNDGSVEELYEKIKGVADEKINN